MKRLDLIIDTLDYVNKFTNLDVAEALAASRSLRDMKPVAWGIEAESGEIIDCITPTLYLKEPGDYAIPLYALGDEK